MAQCERVQYEADLEKWDNLTTATTSC